MRTAPAIPPATDDPNPTRLVLRDGSVVSVRTAVPTDAGRLKRFFHELSPESRYSRFFTASEPLEPLILRFCDTANRSQTMTLLASRSDEEGERIVAVASYMALSGSTAEAAFAVADDFQGKGIATLLLEHLATIARSHGFTHFHATTLSGNTAMLEVFRESGFEIRSKSDAWCHDVELSLTLPLAGVAAAERRRQQATRASLQPVFKPASVVVIGASRDGSSIGSRILRALVETGFRGRVYAVHPAAARLEGMAALRSARDLPAGVDLAVVAVPAASVRQVVDDCAAAGVKALIVVSAGFAECGEAGARAQAALVQQVRGYGMRMIGPNCLGVLNAAADVRLNASFAPVMPEPGRVALSSQSGALGIAILELAAGRHVGLSAFVSVGNKADVSGNDLLEYWESDPDTRIVLLYLESFGNPRRFARIARRVGRTKPIVALKAGRTRDGSRAAGSHTAALASSDAAVDAMFRQTGVIRVDTIDEMFDLAACLEAQPLPPGRRVAIVSNSGGPGILAADACAAAGLNMAAFSAGTRARLEALLPRTASLDNPVDMVAAAGAQEFSGAIAAALADPGVDALVAIFTPVDAAGVRSVVDGIAGGVAAGRAAGCTEKPVLVCLMSAALRDEPFRAGAETLPTYAFPEHAVRALGKCAEYAEWRRQPPSLYWDFEDINVDEARSVCRDAAARGAEWLTADEAFALLRAFGLPIAPARIARSADEAEAIAALLGYPVAAKLAGPGSLHKTDVGGVRLNLSRPEEVRGAFLALSARAAKIPDSTAAGVLIQRMAGSGIETIVGVSHDPVFGPLVAFGSGGVDVEWLGDVALRVAPLSDRDADALLGEIRGARRLAGDRGRPGADIPALREVLLRASRLATELPEIVELDLNPVIAMPPGQGCLIVDARIRVAPPRGIPS